MTQAQLAEALGVTPQAVSKWEKGTGFPDLSAICPLADALGTTTDELLEHKNTLRELNTKWLRLRLKCEKWEASPEELVALDNEILSQFPNDHTSLWRRVCDEFALACRHSDAEEKERWLSLAEEHCADLVDKDSNWENPKYKMVEIMMESGRTDEAIVWAIKCKSPDDAMKKVLRGDELRRHRQKLVYENLHSLLLEMRCDDLDLLQASEDIIRALIPDGNYQWFYDYLMMIEYTRAKYYAARGDSAETMKYLYRALDVAKEKFIKGKGKFPTPIFDELSPESGPMSLLEQYYDFLQERKGLETVYFTEEYQKLLDKVKALI
jgi:transcriptional regulator with XRE-family HTH domain